MLLRSLVSLSNPRWLPTSPGSHSDPTLPVKESSPPRASRKYSKYSALVRLLYNLVVLLSFFTILIITNGKRLLCTTVPWMIWLDMAVYWSIYSMFHFFERSGDDCQLFLPLNLTIALPVKEAPSAKASRRCFNFDLLVLFLYCLLVLLRLVVTSTFSEAIRPRCTTMPWTIWPALVVLWGVCWMFQPSERPADTQNELDEVSYREGDYGEYCKY